MPKFPILQSQIFGDQVKIAGDDYKHIVRVLRFKKGDKIDFFDQNVKTYQSIITNISSKEIIAHIYNTLTVNNDSKLAINLYQSVPKGNKMDMIIQKSSELGVKSITPIYTERTVVKQTSKSKRWVKIALESCKQCGRNKPLKINDPANYKDLIKKFSEKELNILFYENKDSTLKDFLDSINTKYTSINIIIGPEGGFLEEEIAQAEHNGINILGLGPRILRTDTAAVVSVSIVQFYFGDL